MYNKKNNKKIEKQIQILSATSAEWGMRGNIQTVCRNQRNAHKFGKCSDCLHFVGYYQVKLGMFKVHVIQISWDYSWAMEFYS